MITSNSSAKGLTTSTGTLSYTHVVAAGSNITVGFFPWTQNGDLVTSVDLDGVQSATFVTKLNTRASREEYFYILPGVSAGSHTVNVHTTGTPGRTECVSEALNGASQSTTPDATHFVAMGTANPYVCTMTTIADNCWIMMGIDTGGSGAGSASCVLLQDNTPTGAMILYDNSNVAPVHPAGSTTLNVGNSSAGTNIAMMVSIAPIVSAVNGNFFMLM